MVDVDQSGSASGQRPRVRACSRSLLSNEIERKLALMCDSKAVVRFIRKEIMGDHAASNMYLRGNVILFQGHFYSLARGNLAASVTNLVKVLRRIFAFSGLSTKIDRSIAHRYLYPACAPARTR